jgi:hypothetical protein
MREPAFAFCSIPPRMAGHKVRCTLLTLRLSAQLPATSSNNLFFRKSELDAVRWLDLHCHLNAITPCRSSRHVYAEH